VLQEISDQLAELLFKFSFEKQISINFTEVFGLVSCFLEKNDRY